MTPDYSPLWYWVREREAVRLKRAAGEPKPWTADPILQSRRFCNVRREDDKVTVWIRENIRERFAEHPALWFMLCVGRWINRPETLAELMIGGTRDPRPSNFICPSWPGHPDFKPWLMTKVLDVIAERGAQVFTGAYTINAPPGGGSKTKHVAEGVLGPLWENRRWYEDYFAGQSIGGKPTLQGAHKRLKRYDGWGDFMAYQVVVDMRFTHLLRDVDDVETWAAAGPGTMRGLNRLHGRPVKAKISQEQALSEMRAIYRLARQETGVDMDFSDVPNILCETDKYLRIKLGEGDTRQKYPGAA